MISWAHRNVWQKLPRQWRRAALFAATATIAPRPTTNAAASLPFVVVGALRTATGLGQSARLSYDALRAAGLPVFGIDVTTLLRQVVDHPYTFNDGRHVRGAGTLIVHVNSPTMPLAMAGLGSAVVAGKRVVGYWHWELSAVPADWRYGVPFVHEIWAPSAFTASSIAPVVAGRPLVVMPHPVAPCRNLEAREATRPTRPFTVLSIFNMASGFTRKNPVAAITAFRTAFGDDPGARLILKIANPATYPAGRVAINVAASGASNISIIDETLPDAAIDALYDEADALLSLHRSEGFGLTLAEAMLRGIPVVATNWSGNVDFLDDMTGLPVSFRLIPAVDPQGSYQHPDLTWADADTNAAAVALQRLRSDPALAAGLAKRAASFANDAWSVDNYARSVCRQLAIDWPEAGA